MIRYIILLIVVASLVFAVSCSSKNLQKPLDGISSDGDTSEYIAPTIPENSKEENSIKSYKFEDGPRYDMPDDVVKRFKNFVLPFNTMPEPFNSPEELSAQVMIFTAASAIQVEFIPSDDGMSSYIPLSKIRSRIREFFGPGAKLSDDFMDSDLSPYEVDINNDLLIQYYAGNIGGFYLTYALIAVDEGYELWLIDLMDPLFFDRESNQERLFRGEEIAFEEISEIAFEMQYNIYRIVEQDNGRLMLAGFRYENYKNINHFLF